MPKRRADVDPDYDPEAANHHGEMMQGQINQLSDKDYAPGQARPRNYDGSGNVGFDLRPRRKRKRK
jgi:hypothetical protein